MKSFSRPNQAKKRISTKEITVQKSRLSATSLRLKKKIVSARTDVTFATEPVYQPPFENLSELQDFHFRVHPDFFNYRLPSTVRSQPWILGNMRRKERLIKEQFVRRPRLRLFNYILNFSVNFDNSIFTSFQSKYIFNGISSGYSSLQFEQKMQLFLSFIEWISVETGLFFLRFIW